MQEQTTFGKYQLRERINVGGMAEVFLADVDDQANPVALKRVLPNVARNKEFISMFLDEARLSVQLNHGGIAQVLDAGQIDDSYFIALEHVDGKDLGAVLKHLRKAKQAMPMPMACYIAAKICEALHYAHNKKDPAGKPLELVHRDVSPSNLLLSYSGEVKVTDFGLAKANGKATQTQAGIIKGKHGYMSPEQAQGQAIDRRSDIFSAGVCLFEMLTGQRLFKGESDFSTLQRVRQAEVPALSTLDRRVPSELERIVLKMLERSPDQRYANAEEVARDLQSFMADSGNLCGPREVATYMKQTFGGGMNAPKVAAKAPMSDGVTGLAAFDDLNPVSTVSALIELPDAPPPMLMTEQNPPVVVAPSPAPQIEKRAATLVGMPLPARTGNTAQQTPVFGGAAARNAVSARGNTLPPAPAPRASVPPPAPRISASVPPPAPRTSASIPPPAPLQARVSSLPPTQARASSTLPPPPAPRASTPPPAPRISNSVPPPAPLVTAGPSVQLDWPEEDLATSRLDDSMELQPVDATEQLELPAHSVWDDDLATKTEANEAFSLEEEPRAGFSITQKALAAAIVLLAVGGAYAYFSGPSQAALKLEVAPADATVLLDGQELATANPYMIEGLDPEKAHTIEVRKAGYSVWSTEVQLQAGQTLSLPSIALDTESTETGFALDSSPSGAKVIVDGKDTGLITPVRLTDLKSGAHRIELSHEGSAPWATQVHVADQQMVELAPAELTAKAAGAAPTETLVAQNDEVEADDEVAAPTRKLTARQRRIAAKRAKAQARAERRAAGKSAPARASNTRSTSRGSASAPTTVASKGGNGTLRINTQPWSNVFVDGRLIGNTPQMNIQLSAGRHRITLVNQEMHVRKMVEVTITAGQTVTKIVKL